MFIETDPTILLKYTDDQWEALLIVVARECPVPRPIVVIHPQTRKEIILERIAAGESMTAIAQSLGVSLSLVRINAGTR